MEKDKANQPKETLGQRLTMPLGLIDGRKVRFFRGLTYICSALVVGIAAWSAVAQIREVAVAHGQIVPSNATQKIHHLEGGILEALLVSEGQSVEKGQPIMRLRPEGVESDYEQLASRQVTLSLQRERLNALLTGGMADFSGYTESHPDLVREQMDVLTETKNRDERERDKIKLKIAQSETQLATTKEERDSLRRQADIEREQVKIRRDTFDKGYTSRIAFLEASSRLETIEAKLASTGGKVSQLTSELEEARQLLEKTEAERTQKLADERAKVMSELIETVNALRKHRDRVSRLTVRSPERGTIQVLAQKTPGEVIKPGDLVGEIISSQAAMIAEVRLNSKDIGHVKIGDPANIKVSNYDPTGIDIVTGKVLDISATTLETKEGNLYYRTRIALDSTRVGPEERNWPILPGMVVEADIVTGSKSLMKYMLKPVYRSLGTAFSER